MKNYDYVAPYYARHKYDGTITNSIIYPMTRALYGKRVRQPIGGDFGFSTKLVELFLGRGKHVWGTDIARYGIDIWMTTIALTEGAKICQSFLGGKIHDPKDPAQSIGPMFKQVVSTLFYLTDRYQDKWSVVRGSRPTAMYGFQSEVPPEPIPVTLEPMIAKFRQGVNEYKEYWLRLLPETTVRDIIDAAQAQDKDFVFPANLWVRTVYDFAIAYQRHFRETPQQDHTELGDHLVTSLVSLFFGRTASFVKETSSMPTYKAEELIERLCDEFEAMKPNFVREWFNQEDTHDTQNGEKM